MVCLVKGDAMCVCGAWRVCASACLGLSCVGELGCLCLLGSARLGCWAGLLRQRQRQQLSSSTTATSRVSLQISSRTRQLVSPSSVELFVGWVVKNVPV